MKSCIKCKRLKRESEFYQNPNSFRVDSWCRECKNRERLRNCSPEARKEEKLQRKYKISLSDFNALLLKQRGGCAICGNKGPFCVDHCHRLGMVRGLLCGKCNTGLGMLQDSATLVLKAHEYLKKHLTKPTSVVY